MNLEIASAATHFTLKHQKHGLASRSDRYRYYPKEKRLNNEIDESVSFIRRSPRSISARGVKMHAGYNSVVPCKEHPKLAGHQKNNNHSVQAAGTTNNGNFDTDSVELAVIPEQRNWKGIFFSALVIIVVCVLIGISAWLLQPKEDPKNYKYLYDYDAMFDMSWRPFVIDGEWMGDAYVYRDRHRNFVKRVGEEVEILISNETMDALEIYQAILSPDMKYALLSYDVKKVYRHSSTARYYIYTIVTGSPVPLHNEVLQHAAWGTKGNQLTYVLDSDLYYKSDVGAFSVQITDTGKNSNGKIRNGITDWVYEEEMFSSTVANWISTSGSFVAYATFNDTLVPQVDILLYDVPYPKIEKVNYPKVGFPNPIVQLTAYNLKTKTKFEINVPELLKNKEPLLNSFVWTSDDSALVTWSNRYQNITITTSCSVPSNDESENTMINCRVVHEYYADGWNEYIDHAPVPGDDGTFYQIEEKSMGGKGKFHHLLRIDYNQGKNESRFLTTGPWEVTRILIFNKESNRIYYISTENSPLDRHLYSVDVTEEKPTSVCHTCDLSCSYIDVDISEDATWAFLRCKGPDVPRSMQLNLENQETLMIERNLELKEKVENAKMPKVVMENIKIKGENGEYDFQAKLFLPINAQLRKNVPLLLNLYTGPGSQQVNSRFSLDWTTFLVTNMNIAVLMFDGRGSGFRGSDVLKAVNRRLGVFEIEDQITAIKKTLKRHPYISTSKIGVFGWSYGGYASAMLATHPMAISQNLAKCVISVAPVTKWQLYDSIYTERYMGSPVTNSNGYSATNLLSRAKYFKNFQYLLIHGTKDDNVHFQNSAVLEAELVKAEVVHRYQVYTDETHSLSSIPNHTQRHLYKLMNEFLTNCYHST